MLPGTRPRSSTQSVAAPGQCRCPPVRPSPVRLRRLLWRCPPRECPRIGPPLPGASPEAGPQAPLALPQLPVSPEPALPPPRLGQPPRALPLLEPRLPAPPSPHHSAGAVLFVFCAPAPPPPRTCSTWDRRQAAPSPFPSCLRHFRSAVPPPPLQPAQPVGPPGSRPRLRPPELRPPPRLPPPMAWAPLLSKLPSRLR